MNNKTALYDLSLLSRIPVVRCISTSVGFSRRPVPLDAFRQVRDMVVEENREEKVRITALRRVLRHPLRYRYVQKRFNRERKDKQTLINWIRKDIEVGGACCNVKESFVLFVGYNGNIVIP